jgi:hypothetical protein
LVNRAPGADYVAPGKKNETMTLEDGGKNR